jgi:drug/metabolite transporter (DMT)-like permease
MIYVVLLYAIFAAMTFVNSALMQCYPHPIMIGIFRAMGSGMLILGYIACFKHKQFAQLQLSSCQWSKLIAYGILIHGFAMIGFSYSVLYGNPISLCFIYASAPFLTALIEFLHGQECLNLKKITGLIIGSLGLIPILMYNSDLQNTNMVSIYPWWVGNAFAFGSMIMFCYGWILFKQIIKTNNHPIQLLNGIAMVVGGITSTILAITVYGNSMFTLSYQEHFVVLTITFVLSSLITYMLYAYLLQKYSPTFISFAGFLEPAFGLVYGMILIKYYASILDLLSFFMLFIGLYIFYRQEIKDLK